jgi:hypothetical protein
VRLQGAAVTLAELHAEVIRKIEIGHTHIVLVVPGVRLNAMTRVIPGVMGRVLGCTDDGKGTLVDVTLAHLARVLALHKVTGF